MAIFFNVSALVMTVLLGGLFWYGIEESLFWYYNWYDIPLHLLGGVVMGLWGAAVATRLRLSVAHAFVFISAVALFGSVAWEVMEYVSGLTIFEPGFTQDTALDIVCGVVGALSVLILYVPLRQRATLI